jgi:RNA-directed DNA polymerase
MKENIGQSRMLPTQSGNRMSQGLDGVRKAARERKQERFTSLLHHLITSSCVRASTLSREELHRASMVSDGVRWCPMVSDGVRWQEYESGLERRVTSSSRADA